MLQRKSFFIREHVGFMKLSGAYDILDPETRQPLGIVQERPGALVHVLRFLIDKRMLPTKVFVYEGQDAEDQAKLLFSLQRGFTLLRAKIGIHDASGRQVGWLKSKAFSLGGAFRVFSSSGEEVALVKGDWKGWNFRLLDQAQRELGTITKKWAGIGKELFTSADNYIISLNEVPTVEIARLLLAAGLAVDTVYKER